MRAITMCAWSKRTGESLGVRRCGSLMTRFSFSRPELVLLMVWAGHAPVMYAATNEPAPSDSGRQQQPIEDDMFVNSVVRCRVTQRFEIYNPHSVEQLRAVKTLGFTQVI